MPTVVIIRQTHPPSSEEIVRHRPSDEFLEIRARWKESGKIAAQDYVMNTETRTEIKTTVFPDKDTYLEWINDPIVQAYFEDRNQFLKNNGIWKEIEVDHTI